MLLEVCATSDRGWRAVCIRCLRNKKISEDFSTEEECEPCHILTDLASVAWLWLQPGGYSGYTVAKKMVSPSLSQVKLDCCVFWIFETAHKQYEDIFHFYSLIFLILRVHGHHRHVLGVSLSLYLQPPITKWWVVNGWNINFAWTIPWTFHPFIHSHPSLY